MRLSCVMVATWLCTRSVEIEQNFDSLAASLSLSHVQTYRMIALFHLWQDCYGLRRVPEGDWFCDLCTAQRKRPSMGSVCCNFCPAKDGAFKRTHKEQWGGWVHVACALFHSYTGFVEENRKTHADGFERKEVRPKRNHMLLTLQN